MLQCKEQYCFGQEMTVVLLLSKSVEYRCKRQILQLKILKLKICSVHAYIHYCSNLFLKTEFQSIWNKLLEVDLTIFVKLLIDSKNGVVTALSTFSKKYKPFQGFNRTARDFDCVFLEKFLKTEIILSVKIRSAQKTLVLSKNMKDYCGRLHI